MFAGNAAINKATIPHAAIREVTGISNSTPSRTSKKPLSRTNSLCSGRYGGMIFRKNAGFAKCIVPAIIMKIANMHFAIALMRFMYGPQSGTSM